MVDIGEVEDIGALANILGCSVAALPMKYLGLPLGVSFKDTSMWIGVVVQMEHQLPRWMKLYLSKGGT